jgi:hypothetical protein
MRQMTIDEQRVLIKQLHHAEFWSDMMKIDSICYGGDAELISYRDQNSYAKEVIAAFPKDILEDYVKEVRKAEADKLRIKADNIENGRDSA